MKMIRFIQSCPPYNCGECATFAAHIAGRFVRLGAAVEVVRPEVDLRNSSVPDSPSNRQIKPRKGK